MPIVRCTAQTRETLEEIYQEEANSDYSFGIGKFMLSVIELINNTFIETKIYAVTSHYRLLLFPTDNRNLHYHFSLIGWKICFSIDYLMPEEKAPWTDARVSKEVLLGLDEESFKDEDILKYIVIAMTESKGWMDSQELQTLYRKYNQV